MKKTICLFLISTTVILVSCVGFDVESNLYLKNNSNQNIRCISLLGTPPLYLDSLCIKVYPDTTLPMRWMYTEYDREVQPKEYEEIAMCTHWTFEFKYEDYNTDTLSVYILDSGVYDSVPWNTIRKHYMLLQRYDLSLNDTKMIWLAFPPDSTMKHIHMWPPYGTYDKQGCRNDNYQ